MNSNRPSKRLIIRLSSLGDVILSTSALAVPLSVSEVHWVVAKEYAGLLRGHPRIKKVWEFDRSDGGIFSWLSLCGELWGQGFTEVVDLHSTLRSHIAHLYFFTRSILGGQKPVWKTISKERVRLYGLFGLKKLWPKNLYPTRLVERAARLAGGAGSEHPDLRHLICSDRDLPPEFLSWFAECPEFIAVMPSSKWDGKKWSVRGFFEVVAKMGLPVLVLGEKSDRESVLLMKMLEQAQFPCFSGIGRFRFPQLAFVLSRARVCFGNDTGLAHLAESVGTSVVTVFGPTIPEMGFGPWRPGSRAVGIDLWCKPCGKDGRYCFRVTDRYACQKNLLPAQVFSALQGPASSKSSSGKPLITSVGTGSSGSSSSDAGC